MHDKERFLTGTSVRVCGIQGFTSGGWDPRGLDPHSCSGIVSPPCRRLSKGLRMCGESTSFHPHLAGFIGPKIGL